MVLESARNRLLSLMDEEEGLDYFMNEFLNALKSLHGGKLLDVATSHGDFLRELTENLGGFSEAVGIDISEERIKQARERSDSSFEFLVMDAEHLSFANSSFDTVAMRHSLHHLRAPDAVLAEIHRVLKAGGLLIVGETIQEPHSAQENSYRHNHHWWAKVDRVKGIPHNETYTCNQVLKAVRRLPVDIVDWWEFLDEPPESEHAEVLEETLQHTRELVQELRQMGGHDDLVAEGEALATNMERNGITFEKIVYVIARKRQE